MQIKKLVYFSIGMFLIVILAAATVSTTFDSVTVRNYIKIGSNSLYGIGTDSGMTLSTASDTMAYSQLAALKELKSERQKVLYTIQNVNDYLSLINDSASPGNSMTYGTTSAGVKGYENVITKINASTGTQINGSRVSLGNISHSTLSDTGVQLHTAIDAHLSATGNTHAATSAQIGADTAGTAASVVGSHESTYNHAHYNTAYTEVNTDSGNWDTAYTHSQLITGNPHAVTAVQAGAAAIVHTHSADSTTSGTFDGDRLPAMSTTKKGGVPATGTPSDKYLRDDGTWQDIVVNNVTNGTDTGNLAYWSSATSSYIPLGNDVSGKFLKSNGASAAPSWETVSGTGTVTSITATAPLTGGVITISGSIGMDSANASRDGYLTKEDWAAFNAKGSSNLTLGTTPTTAYAGDSGAAAYAAAVTNATSSNTASTIVKRDGSGNFSAGTITANLTGNASGTAANVTGTVAVANGGTGATAAGAALANLGGVPTSRTINGLALDTDRTIVTQGGIASNYLFCDDVIFAGTTPVWHELERQSDGGIAGTHTATGTSYSELDRYVTAALNTTTIPGGMWSFELFCNMSSGSGQIQALVYRIDSSGTISGSVLGTAQSSTFTNTTVAPIIASIYIAEQTGWATTDRIGVVLQGKRVGGAATMTFHHEQSLGYVSNVTTPLSLLHNQLNGLNLGDYRHLTATQLSAVQALGTASKHADTEYQDALTSGGDGTEILSGSKILSLKAGANITLTSAADSIRIDGAATSDSDRFYWLSTTTSPSQRAVEAALDDAALPDSMRISEINSGDDGHFPTYTFTSSFNDSDLLGYIPYLKAAYSFHSNSIGNDSKGSNTLTNSGVVSNGDGKYGWCASIGETYGSYLYANPVGSDLQITGEFFISLWVKCATNGDVFRLYGDDDLYRINVNTSMSSVRATDGVHSLASSGLNDSQWHHIALNATHDTIYLYVDSVEVDSDSWNNTISGVTKLRLGPTGWGYVGLVDEIYVFAGMPGGVVMTSTHVNALYNSGAGKFYGVRGMAKSGYVAANVSHTHEASVITSGTLDSPRMPTDWTGSSSITTLGTIATGNIPAAIITSGNLDTSRLPTGGAWSLSSDLNINSNTFVIDQSASTVGIGTASPGNKLHVYENTSSVYAARVNNAHADGNGLQVQGGSSTSTLALLVSSYDGGNELLKVRGDATLFLPLYGSGTMSVGSGGQVSTSSDARLKTELDKPCYGLATVLSMKPKRFVWKDSDTEDYGFFAQDFIDTLPEAVGKPAKEGGMYGLHDRPIIAALVQSVKELSSQIDELKAEVAKLKAK